MNDVPLAKVKMLVVVSFLAVLSVMASGVRTEEIDGVSWCYQLANGEAHLNSAKGLGKDVRIPSRLGGCPVTVVRPFAFHERSLRSVVIPNSVTNIGRFSFADCDYLTAVTIPEGVIEIGEAAFRSCRELKSVNFPSSLRKIRERAFEMDANLEKLELPSGLTQIGEESFHDCEKLTDIKIPENIREIPFRAFMRCSTLTNVVMHENVSVIGEEAFSECYRLANLKLPHGLRAIPRLAFCQSGLKTLTIPENVRVIGDHAFRDCRQLESVTVPAGLTRIGKLAFESCSIKSLNLPADLRQIGEDAFLGANLTNITVAIGNHRYVMVDGMLVDRRLKSILTCEKDSLVDVRIPSFVTNVAKGAFSGCRGIRSLSIPSGLCDLDFGGYLPWSEKITNVVVEIGNPVFKIVNGCLVDGKRKRLIRCCGNVFGKVEIPEGIADIEQYAFYKCDGLTDVRIPSSVTNIGSHAFAYTRMLSVTLPSGIRAIGDYAFWECNLLEKIIACPGEGERLMSLLKRSGRFELHGDELLVDRKNKYGRRENVWCDECAKWCDPRTGIIWAYSRQGDYAVVEGVNLPKAFFGQLTIPEMLGGSQVKVLDKAQISGKGITSVRIPDSVDEIRWGAFNTWGCGNLCAINLPHRLLRDGSSIDREQRNGTGALAMLRLLPLKTIVVSPSNVCITAKGGIVFDKAMTRVVLCGGGVSEIELPKSVTNLWGLAYDSSELEAFRIENGHPNLYSMDGVLYDKGMSKVIRCPIRKSHYVFPRSVCSIGEKAFSGCRLLNQMTVPSSVTNMGDRAFCDCTGLTAVTLSEGLVVLGNGTFCGCEKLEAVVMPSTVLRIGNGVFGECASLKTFTAQKPSETRSLSDRFLGDQIFRGCVSLRSIVLTQFGDRIGERTFAGCTNLTSIAMPKSLQMLHPTALIDTPYYAGIPNGQIAFNERLYGMKCRDDLNDIVVSSNISSVADYALSGLEAITNVTLAATVTNIGARAFSGCYRMERMVIRGTLKQIGNHAFYGCSKLTKIGTPAINDELLRKVLKQDGFDVERVGGVLNICPSNRNSSGRGLGRKGGVKKERQIWKDPQTGIEWRYSVYDGKVSFGSFNNRVEPAIVDVSYAGDLVIPENINGYPVTWIYESAFWGCTNLTSLHIPKSVIEFSAVIFNLPSLTNVTVDARNAKYKSLGRFLTTVNGRELISVCAGNTKRIDIPEGIRQIDRICSAPWLEEFHIPSTVTDIHATAFWGCHGLAKKYDPDNLGFMVIDGWMIPYGAVSGRKLVVPQGVRHIACGGVRLHVAEVELPEGLQTIGKDVFARSGIESIVFPSTLEVCEGFTEKPKQFGSWRAPERPLRNITFSSGGFSFHIPDTVHNIVFAPGVSNIDAAASFRHPGLSGGTNVRSVKLPAGLLSITSFPRFPNLTDITIPASVTNICCDAFSCCSNLTSVCVEKSGKVESVAIDEFRKQWNLNCGVRHRLPPRRQSERKSLRGRLNASEKKAVERDSGSIDKSAREIERKEQIKQLQLIQEELKRIRSDKASGTRVSGK